MASEAELQIQVADYLRLQYPDVMFHSDFGSGVKLTPGQAVKQKRQNGGRRAWPDMEIPQPVAIRLECKNGNRWHKYGDTPSIRGRFASEWLELSFHGFYLELKKEGETIHPGPRAKKRYKSKDGLEYKTEHLMEQADCLYELRERGYCAEFAIGFDEAKKIIDEYLGGK